MKRPLPIFPQPPNAQQPPFTIKSLQIMYGKNWSVEISEIVIEAVDDDIKTIEKCFRASNDHSKWTWEVKITLKILIVPELSASRPRWG